MAKFPNLPSCWQILIAGMPKSHMNNHCSALVLNWRLSKYHCFSSEGKLLFQLSKDHSKDHSFYTGFYAHAGDYHICHRMYLFNTKLYRWLRKRSISDEDFANDEPVTIEDDKYRVKRSVDDYSKTCVELDPLLMSVSLVKGSGEYNHDGNTVKVIFVLYQIDTRII